MHDVKYQSPHFLIEMPDKADCRFAGLWLLKAAEAQGYWSQLLRDPAYKETTSALCYWCEPCFESAALETLAALRQGDPPFHPITSDHVLTVDTEFSESGVFIIEFAMMVELGFFALSGGSYRMTVPDSVTTEGVRRAALKVASTKAGAEAVQPESLLHTLPQAEAEAARRTRLALRTAGFKDF